MILGYIQTLSLADHSPDTLYRAKHARIFIYQITKFHRHEKTELQKFEEDKDFVSKEVMRHQGDITTKEIQLRTLQNQNDQIAERVRSTNLAVNKLAAELNLPGG